MISKKKMLQSKGILVLISISSVISILCIFSYLSLETELENLRRQTFLLESHVKQLTSSQLVPMQERLIYSRSQLYSNDGDYDDGETFMGDTSGLHFTEDDGIKKNQHPLINNNNLDKKRTGDESHNQDNNKIINENQVNTQKVQRQEHPQKQHGILSSNEDAGDQVISLNNNNFNAPSFSSSKQIQNQQQEKARNPSKSTDVIFYNRVPKTGSTTFVGIVYEISKDLNYHVIHVNTSRNSHVLSLEDQERFVRNISDWKVRRPALFHGHISFMEFSKFSSDTVNPIYINMIRDPIERLVSYYYFLRFGDDFSQKQRRRKGNRVSFDECLKRKEHDCDAVNMWLQIPFFCGHSFKCWIPGSQWALDQAKRNLIDKYLVVGITEEMHDFFALLEVVMPRFFNGSTRVYEEGRMSHLRKTFKKQPVTQETLDILRQSKVWLMEQEFYDFAKSQFHFLKRLTFGGSSREESNSVLSTGSSEGDSVFLKQVLKPHPQKFFYDKLRPKFI